MNKFQEETAKRYAPLGFLFFMLLPFADILFR